MYSNNITINSDNLNQVKKLAYIVTLDNMLKTYDNMEQQDEDTILKCGRSVSDLTDAISMKLTHLTNDQRIALYYYNVQMKQLHQDMDELAGRQASKAHDKADVTAQQDETLCLLIDPSVDDEELKIHNVIKRLVRRQGIQEICTYLYQLKNEKKVMLPQNAEKTYHELVRMGMPGGEGYSLKTFMKYYRR